MSQNNKKPIEYVEIRERPIKSIAKSITWRLIASTTTFVLAYLFFRDDPQATEKAGGVAIAEGLIKILLYFLHERIWNLVRWGKMRVYVRYYNILRNKVYKRIFLNNTNDDCND